VLTHSPGMCDVQLGFFGVLAGKGHGTVPMHQHNWCLDNVCELGANEKLLLKTRMHAGVYTRVRSLLK